MIGKKEQKFTVVLPGVVSRGHLVGFEVWSGLRRHYIPADAPILVSRVGHRDNGRDLYAITFSLLKRIVAAWRGHPWWELWDVGRDWTISAADPVFRQAHDPLAALYFSYLQGDLLIVNRLKAWRLKRFWVKV